MEIENDKNIIIKNIDKYDISFYNNSLILKKKLKYTEPVNIDEILEKYNFTNSDILEVVIDNKKLDIKKYFPVLRHIYNLINSKKLILDNTIMNIKIGNLDKQKGFKYIEKHNISVQRTENNKTIKELINMCNCCNIHKKIKIQLSNNEIITI
jgi:hypothetical protein